ncbi:MAG: hypothetical protein MI673_08095 [Thiotrichales bacterium]|nr:hypothetical protein [Thiotrichales bacterium]
MFTLGISGLITAYVLLALLLLSINLYSKWSWQVKAGTVLITSVFYVITYFSFPPLLGWATEQEPPEKFRILSVHVEQPNKITGGEGAIYLWTAGIENLATDVEPRAYMFPYSNELHERVLQVKSKLNKSILQLGEFEEPEAGSLENLEQKTGLSNVSAKLSFYDLPDPLIPDK